MDPRITQATQNADRQHGRSIGVMCLSGCHFRGLALATKSPAGAGVDIIRFWSIKHLHELMCIKPKYNAARIVCAALEQIADTYL
jgi:hypothetical protein